MGGSIGKLWSAATTDGGSMLARGNALRSVAFEPGQAQGGADFCGALSCEERDGYVWVYMNTLDAIAGDDSGGAGALPCSAAKYKITHLSWRAAFAHRSRIIGLMTRRTPFVHQSWFLAEAGSIHEKASNSSRFQRFRMSPHSAEHEQRAVSVAEDESPASVTRRLISCCRISARKSIKAGRCGFPAARR